MAKSLTIFIPKIALAGQVDKKLDGRCSKHGKIIKCS
jgi:hypothetical protein